MPPTKPLHDYDLTAQDITGLENGELDKNRLLALLTQDKIDKYRSGATYEAELTIEDAQNARQWVLKS